MLYTGQLGLPGLSYPFKAGLSGLSQVSIAELLEFQYYVVRILEKHMNYPIKITRSNTLDTYTMTLPDLPGCKVQCFSINEGMVELRKAMKSHLEVLAEYGERIPSSTPIDEHMKTETGANVIWAIIEFDITPYLGKSHKINVTLPELLIKKIDDRVSKSEDYKTRSGFIAKACLVELEKS